MATPTNCWELILEHVNVVMGISLLMDENNADFSIDIKHIQTTLYACYLW